MASTTRLPPRKLSRGCHDCQGLQRGLLPSSPRYIRVMAHRGRQVFLRELRSISSCFEAISQHVLQLPRLLHRSTTAVDVCLRSRPGFLTTQKQCLFVAPLRTSLGKNLPQERTATHSPNTTSLPRSRNTMQI